MASRLSITSSFTSPVQVLQSFINGDGCSINIVPNNPLFAHAEGSMCKANGKFAHAEGVESVATGVGAHASGYKCSASGNYSQAIGTEAKSIGSNSIAIGNKTESTNEKAISIGSEAYANGLRSIALGSRAKSNGECSIAIGALEEGSINQVVTTGKNSITIGCNKIETVKDKTITLSASDVDINAGNFSSSANNFAVNKNEFNFNINKTYGITANNTGVRQYSDKFKLETTSTYTSIKFKESAEENAPFNNIFSIDANSTEEGYNTVSTISSGSLVITSGTITIGTNDVPSTVSIAGSCSISSSLTINGESSDNLIHYIKTKDRNLISTDRYYNNVYILDNPFIETVGSQKLIAKSLLGYSHTQVVKNTSGVYELFDRTKNIISNATGETLIKIPENIENIDLEIFITVGIGNNTSIKISNYNNFKLYSAQTGVLDNLPAGSTHIITISEISTSGDKKVVMINRLELSEIIPNS